MGRDKDIKKTEDHYVETLDYRELIIDMVQDITNEGTLAYLHTFIKLFIKKWG